MRFVVQVFIQRQVFLPRCALHRYRSPPAPLRPRRVSRRPWTRAGFVARRAARRVCASWSSAPRPPALARWWRASRAAPQKIAALQRLVVLQQLSVAPRLSVRQQPAAGGRCALLRQRARVVREDVAGWPPSAPPPRRSTLPSDDLRRCSLQPRPALRAVLPPFVSWLPPARPLEGSETLLGAVCRRCG